MLKEGRISLISEKIEWDELIYYIKKKRCTPFVGAGACTFPNKDKNNEPWLPLGSTISKKLAEEYEYPLDDSNMLDHVSQYVAIVSNDDMRPKNFIVRLLEEINPPDFSKEEYKNTPHAILADLNLPLYITTNYDEFMEHALKSRDKNPYSEICKWNMALENKYKIKNKSREKKSKYYEPTPDNPLVYHLHGHQNDEQSIVLTETDYLDFLITLSKEDILPYSVSMALNSNSLLFIGYSLKDINFRFIFRGLMHLLGEGIGSGQKLPSIAVQLPSGFSEEKKEQAIRYLDTYSQSIFKISVYWGNATDFSKELREHWINKNVA